MFIKVAGRNRRHTSFLGAVTDELKKSDQVSVEIPRDGDELFKFYDSVLAMSGFSRSAPPEEVFGIIALGLTSKATRRVRIRPVHTESPNPYKLMVTAASSEKNTPVAS